MAAELNSITISSSPQQQLAQTNPSSTITLTEVAPTKATSNTAVDKTLGSAANLIKLLPTGTVLAFQSLMPSFSNRGECSTSNVYLTIFLLIICSISCCFFSFTDSFIGSDGKVYYGMATFKGFYIFNYDYRQEGEMNRKFKELEKLRIRVMDYVHAFFSCFVFLALAFSDSDVQKCFFNQNNVNAMELLENLPLGVGVLSSLVFLIFPTTRKGIGYSDTANSTG